MPPSTMTILSTLNEAPALPPCSVVSTSLESRLKRKRQTDNLGIPQHMTGENQNPKLVRPPPVSVFNKLMQVHTRKASSLEFMSEFDDFIS